MPTIAIVAGEASGDLLGSALVIRLKAHRPDLKFVGIGGPKMQEAGVDSLFPMERLAVRGYFEVLRHVWGILRIRHQLLRYLKQNPPDVFIGVDAPDFNLGLECALRRAGIRTIHYVSPSIWAWRGWRIRKIGRAATRVLTLFPFEVALYEAAGIPATYVGHPLADVLPDPPDLVRARQALRLPGNGPVFALLPGSRQSELDAMADLFVKTAMEIHQHAPDAMFLMPVISYETRAKLEDAISANAAWDLPVTVLFGHAHLAMEAADVVIVASGTATLEAALLRKPMVITYRMSSLSWHILRHMHYQNYVGLPNILAGRGVVPELLQGQATPARVAETALRLLHDPVAVRYIREEFAALHALLRRGAADQAAQAVLSCLQ